MHYPGRSAMRRERATATERWQEGIAEVSRGHSKAWRQAEGPKVKGGGFAVVSMEKADAEKKAEMPELDLWGSGQNPRGHRSKSASKPTVATGTKSAAGEATIEAVVARENMLRALRAVEGNAGSVG